MDVEHFQGGFGVSKEPEAVLLDCRKLGNRSRTAGNSGTEAGLQRTRDQKQDCRDLRNRSRTAENLGTEAGLQRTCERKQSFRTVENSGTEAVLQDCREHGSRRWHFTSPRVAGCKLRTGATRPIWVGTTETTKEVGDRDVGRVVTNQKKPKGEKQAAEFPLAPGEKKEGSTGESSNGSSPPGLQRSREQKQSSKIAGSTGINFGTLQVHGWLQPQCRRETRWEPALNQRDQAENWQDKASSFKFQDSGQ
ncbi:hypothetical protein D4764_04G0010710 [Takifugu flavidus]|uniref:Uncharacterized protein n=1 Tax=Takifugu flavidus TaxID=433684 RepID=A0A5C6N4N5_9TELE|nr:hypothetical protein D4764_04G0010710 [Takifugu flavidus]